MEKEKGKKESHRRMFIDGLTNKDLLAQPVAYTFDDLNLVPQRSGVESRKLVSMDTQISRRITLRIPIIASFMDTVCDSRMAITLAQLGGLGIIHRWMTIEDQVREVERVKRKENIIIEEPYILPPEATLGEIWEFINKHDTHGILIVEEMDGRKILRGLISHRDIKFKEDMSLRADQIMTPYHPNDKDKNRLIVAPPNITDEEAILIFDQYKIEKLPLVDMQTGELVGLKTARDTKNRKNPLAIRDEKGRLVCAASVGVREANYLERVGALLEAGCDLIVVAIAHGQLESCLVAVRTIKKHFPDVDLLAGSVATAQGVEDLFQAGADGVLVGVGPGSICETRRVAGVGVPQITALLWASQAAKKWGKPILGDGGIRGPSDVNKAIAAGAAAVVVGGELAGTDESPGEIIEVNGRPMKFNRGLASADAKNKLHLIENRVVEKTTPGGNAEVEFFLGDKFYTYVEPEGVESAYVPYRGPAWKVLRKLFGGLRSAMTYSGARTIKEFQKNPRWAPQTNAGFIEGKPHDLFVERG